MQGTHVKRLSYRVKIFFNTLARPRDSGSVIPVKSVICLLYGKTITATDSSHQPEFGSHMVIAVRSAGTHP